MMKKLIALAYLFSVLSFAETKFDGIAAFGAPIESESLVRFAVIGDITGGERKGIINVASEGLEALKPDFILSVGDLIEGGTEDIKVLDNEWRQFQLNLANKNTRFYPTVGNHDITNMVMRKWYSDTVGPRYYHFKYKDILFLIMDSEDFSADNFSYLRDIRDEAMGYLNKDMDKFYASAYINSPDSKYGVIRPKQADYFVNVVEQYKDVRWTFVLMHKPVWRRADEQGFSRVEQALKDRNYTVFNGHVHDYMYTERYGQDYIQMGTTGGIPLKEQGELMDHIMWVSIDKNEPEYLNVKLNGMRDLKGNIPAGGDSLCFDKAKCQ